LDHVDLRWITKSELNNDYFDVERSQNGTDWSYVTREDGAGNSSVEQNYYAIDPDPLFGTSYYRLKQVDFDGNYSYSHIVAVSKDIIVNIYPNPGSGEIFIASELTENDIQIYNTRGQRVNISMVKQNELWRISVADLANGTYFVHFNTEAGLAVERLIVSH